MSNMKPMYLSDPCRKHSRSKIPHWPGEKLAHAKVALVVTVSPGSMVPSEMLVNSEEREPVAYLVYAGRTLDNDAHKHIPEQHRCRSNFSVLR